MRARGFLGFPTFNRLMCVLAQPGSVQYCIGKITITTRQAGSWAMPTRRCDGGGTQSRLGPNPKHMHNPALGLGKSCCCKSVGVGVGVIAREKGSQWHGGVRVRCCCSCTARPLSACQGGGGGLCGGQATQARAGNDFAAL